jgi:hypothetical protein
MRGDKAQTNLPVLSKQESSSLPDTAGSAYADTKLFNASLSTPQTINSPVITTTRP